METSVQGFSTGILDIYGFEIFEKNGFEQVKFKPIFNTKIVGIICLCLVLVLHQLCQRETATNLHRTDSQSRTGKRKSFVCFWDFGERKKSNLGRVDKKVGKSDSNLVDKFALFSDFTRVQFERVVS